LSESCDEGGTGGKKEIYGIYFPLWFVEGKSLEGIHWKMNKNEEARVTNLMTNVMRDRGLHLINIKDKYASGPMLASLAMTGSVKNGMKIRNIVGNLSKTLGGMNGKLLSHY
jgi:hypothetical protein